VTPLDLPPSAINVRLGVPSDACRIAEVQVRSWQAAYRGMIPDAYLDRLTAEKRVLTWERVLADPEQLIFVAETRDAGVIGFGSLIGSGNADAAADTGELSALYLAPMFWGQGGGTALVRAVLEAARARQYHALTLWVLVSNTRARRFYEKCGFTADGAEKTERRSPEVVLHEVRYRLDLPTFR
jgi:RimJ/RimL family protein N-acetyltransferase